MIRWDVLEKLCRDIKRVSYVLQFGNEKYGVDNWLEGEGLSYRRLFSACMRHMFAWLRGEQWDPDTNLPHLAHAVACLLMLMYYERTSNGQDDRSDDRGR